MTGSLNLVFNQGKCKKVYFLSYLLHDLTSLRLYGQFPPQHSTTLFDLVRVCVPALPHWWLHPLHPDQLFSWQFLGGGGGGLRRRRRRRHPSTCVCGNITRPNKNTRSFMLAQDSLGAYKSCPRWNSFLSLVAVVVSLSCFRFSKYRVIWLT